MIRHLGSLPLTNRIKSPLNFRKRQHFFRSRSCLESKSSRPHLKNRLFNSRNDPIDLLIRMRNRKHTDPLLPGVNSFFDQQIKENFEIERISEIFETKLRSEIRKAKRDLLLFEKCVQLFHQAIRLLRHRFLQIRSFANQKIERRICRRQSERMPIVRSSCKNRLRRRRRIIPEFPISAIDPIEKPGFPRNRTQRKTTTDNFPISHQIRFDSKPGLSTARMNPKSGNHLVKNQRNIEFFRQFPQSPQKSMRLKSWSSTLNRLDHHRRQMPGIFSNPVERLIASVIENPRVF